jgi:hypothetical protein
MNYSGFKANAVVDWIDIEITTAVPTQQRWIRRDLRRILCLAEGARDIWVEPINPGPGGVSCVFRIRLHDAPANSYGELERIMGALAQGKPFAARPKVHAIEIAVDFYGKGQANIAALPDLTEQLQTGIAARGNPRQFDPGIGSKGRNAYLSERCTGEDKRGTDYWLAADANAIDPALVLNIGNKGDQQRCIQGDDICWRVYFKRTDKGGMPLPPDEQRARAEFTLQGAELTGRGITDLDSLSGYRFERLADLLHFRRLKPLEQIVEGMNPFAAYAVRHLWGSRSGSVTTWSLGLRAHRRDRRTGQPRTPDDRKHSVHTEADDDLNRKVRKSLAALSHQFPHKIGKGIRPISRSHKGLRGET